MRDALELSELLKTTHFGSALAQQLQPPLT